MQNRRFGYVDKNELPNTAVEVPNGTISDWAKGVYIPIGIYNEKALIAKILNSSGVETNLSSYDAYILKYVLIDNVTGQNQAAIKTSVTYGDTPYTQYTLNTIGGIGSASQIVFAPYIYNGSFNQYYTFVDYDGQYVYIPVKLLTMDVQNKAIKVYGLDNTDYPIYIEPYI